MTSSLKHGILTGVISGVWVIGCFTITSWVSDLLQLHISPTNIRAYSGLLSIIILVMGIFLAMRAVKRANGFQLTYGQALKTGMIVSVITGIMVALFTLLYCTIINPGYTAYMVSEIEKEMILAHKAPAVISGELEKIRKEFSTPMQVGMALIGQIVAGVISSLILGLFVRTTNKHS
ncbi:MAG: DUF4199 domain-containing protein [Chitinophagaceae bacterium]